jgi:hypothetical protein
MSRADSILGDQTMTEVSASGGAYRDYLRFTRPAVARQMRAFGLEFEFCAAERDGLRLAQPCAFSGDVPDSRRGWVRDRRLDERCDS